MVPGLLRTVAGELDVDKISASISGGSSIAIPVGIAERSRGDRVMGLSIGIAAYRGSIAPAATGVVLQALARYFNLTDCKGFSSVGVEAAS